jgi:RHS repeat-associated protein
VGNRLVRTGSLGPIGQTTASYDARDRLEPATNNFDVNGNTLWGDVSPAPVQTAADEYDPLGRLVKRTVAGKTIELVYDGDGHRVRKVVTAGGTTTTTYYLVDDRNPSGYAQVLEEITPGPSFTLRRYGLGLARLSVREPNGPTRFYVPDGHGSVRLLTDLAGVVTDTYTYDAFGILLAQSGPTTNWFRYAGEYYDPDLGLIHLRQREMNPNTGRFWTPDSFEGFHTDPLSLHKYLYAHADPVNRVDRSGHFALPTFLADFGNRLTIAAATFMATHGALAETTAFVAALGIYHSAQLLSTGIDPETGEPATAVAAVFAITDFLPGGKLITKPIRGRQATELWREAARNIWDALSKVSREGHHVHHRIPLEWAHLFPEMNPNRISNLKLVPRAIHEGADGVSTAWAQFRHSLGGRTPTPEEVLQKAAEIDARFGQHFKSLE